MSFEYCISIVVCVIAVSVSGKNLPDTQRSMQVYCQTARSLFLLSEIAVLSFKIFYVFRIMQLKIAALPGGLRDSVLAVTDRSNSGCKQC